LASLYRYAHFHPWCSKVLVCRELRILLGKSLTPSVRVGGFSFDLNIQPRTQFIPQAQTNSRKENHIIHSPIGLKSTLCPWSWCDLFLYVTHGGKVNSSLTYELTLDVLAALTKHYSTVYKTKLSLKTLWLPCKYTVLWHIVFRYPLSDPRPLYC